MLLEGQLGEAEELELLGVASSLEADESPDEDDPPPPPPPPLQEITRRLKLKTIRKKRSFFIYFP